MRKLLWGAYWALVSLLLLAALAVIALRLALPWAEAYREPLERQLAAVLAGEVRIGGLQGRWEDGHAVLEMTDLRVRQVERGPLDGVEVRSAHLALNLGASLRNLRPVFSALRLEEPVIRLRQGVAAPASETAYLSRRLTLPVLHSDRNAALLTLLLQQQEVSINGAELVYTSNQGATARLAPLDLQLRSDGRRHQLKLSARPASATGQAALFFAAEVSGNPRRNPIRFYLDLNGMDEALLNPWLGLAEIRLDQLQARQQLWGEIRANRLQSILARTTVERLKYAEVELGDIALHSAVLRSRQGYQVQLSHGRLRAGGLDYSLPRIAADLTGRGEEKQLATLMLDQLDLGQLRRWLLAQPFLPPSLRQGLEIQQPEGQIRNLRVAWDGDDLQQFQLAADLAAVNLEPWAGVPGLKGINGLLRADRNGGRVHLRSDAFQMYFPGLETAPWPYRRAEGTVRFRIAPDGLTLDSGHLQLVAAEERADGRFRLRLPFDPQAQTDLTLMIGVQDVPVKALEKYMPPQEIGRETHRWLQGAIQAGHVRRGSFILNGNTRPGLPGYQFPTVQLWLDLEDAGFAYDRDWPPLGQGRGQLYYSNDAILVQLQQGRIYGSQTTGAWAWKAPDSQTLQVVGQLQGGLADIRRLLLETPVREAIGSGLDGWEMAGAYRGLFELTLALDGSTPPRVEVAADLDRGRLASARERLAFEKIRGPIRYSTGTGLAAPKLQATLFDNDLIAVIGTEADAKSHTWVSLEGSLTAEQLRSWLGLDLLRVAKGRLNYQAQLDICPAIPDCDKLHISSTLEGMRIEAPAPLGKAAAEKRPLTVQLNLGRGEPTLTLNYAEQLRAVLRLKEAQLERGQLVFGGAPPLLPDRPGLWLGGALARLNLGELQAFLAAAGLTGAGEPATTAVPLLQEVDLRLGLLELGETPLREIALRAVPAVDGWYLHGNSRDLRGKLFLPRASDRPYQATLNHLHLYMDKKEQAAEGAAPATLPTSLPAAAGLRPTDLVPVDMTIESLRINDKPFGHWQFELRPDDQGATVQFIAGDMQGIKISGDARWSEHTPYTVTLLKLQGTDVAPALESWGLGRPLESGFVSADLRLIWPGAPWQFDLAQLSGDLAFVAKDGRILETGGSGFLRILGLLNLQSLGRRLRLDFSDLYQEGLAFDRMGGSYLIENGIARSRESFRLTGPAVDMSLHGSLDLVRNTVDQEMEVVLPLTGNLPIMGVLLGQPQVAGAVYILDKLFGDKISKVSSIRYHLSGDWGDPQIELQQQGGQTPKDPLFPGGDK